MARLGQFRRDTMANWKKENPIIADGEFILIANDSNSPHSYDYWACGDGTTEFINLKFKAVKEGTGVQGITDELSELSGLALSSKGAKKAIDSLQQQIDTKTNDLHNVLQKETQDRIDGDVTNKGYIDKLETNVEKELSKALYEGEQPDKPVVVGEQTNADFATKALQDSEGRVIKNTYVTNANLGIPTFNVTKAYNIGDVVFYETDGKYYEFTQNHAVGAWDSSQVEQYNFVNKKDIVQESGEAEDKIMSQKAVSDKLSDLSKSNSYFANPKANKTTLQIAQAIKELYISDFNEDGWLLATIGRNHTTGYDTPWCIQFYTKDLSKNIKFNFNENPEGDSGISLSKLGDNYVVVDWNKIPDGFYKTSLTSNDYLLKNDIIYSLDANPTIKAEILHSVEQTIAKKTSEVYSFVPDDGLGDFSLKKGWVVSDGKLKNTLYDIDSRLLLSKSFTLDPRKFICDFDVSIKTGEVFFGTQRDFDYYGDGNMLVSIDFTTNRLNYYGKFKNGNIPSKAAKYIEISINENDISFRFIIKYINRGVIIELISLLTGKVLGTLDCVDGINTPAFVCYDNYFIYASQEVAISRILVTAKKYVGECKALIFGDSITYGQGNSINDTWSYKLAKYLENSFVSGLSGGQISQVISRLTTECKSQIPNYVIICIGTNGGNTTSNLNEVISLCKKYGSTPILCTTPQLRRNTGISYTNQTIINVAKSNNIPVVRFDIATSLNYDLSQGQDESQFHDSVHPNAQGGENMYNRLFIDAPCLL